MESLVINLVKIDIFDDNSDVKSFDMAKLALLIDNSNIEINVQTLTESFIHKEDKRDFKINFFNYNKVFMSIKDNFTMVAKISDAVDLIRLKKIFHVGNSNEFNLRTEQASEKQYFLFYSYLYQQQNMMQDSIRSSTYQKAFFENFEDFKDKIVLDIGTGSGLLSFFAVQAGAKKVYAIEASEMASKAQQLVNFNLLNDKIFVIKGKIEEIMLEELVDVIISEPIGYLLYNERMLESYLYGKKFLKPNGLMFPSSANLFVAPFTDEILYLEIFNKSAFWLQRSFYNINLTSLHQEALRECFSQPIVDTFDPKILLSSPISFDYDFSVGCSSDLETIYIPLKYVVNNPSSIHGLAFWFDVVYG